MTVSAGEQKCVSFANSDTQIEQTRKMSFGVELERSRENEKDIIQVDGLTLNGQWPKKRRLANEGLQIFVQSTNGPKSTMENWEEEDLLLKSMKQTQMKTDQSKGTDCLKNGLRFEESMDEKSSISCSLVEEKRHPNIDISMIKRPMNPFIQFSKEYRRVICT